ncbi:hypothetical protein LCGC14_2051230, partial [marine sediment metagenome]
EQARLFGQRLMNSVSVEAPFVRQGAPETGFRFKNWFSERAVHEEQVLDIIKKIRKQRLTQAEELDAILASESRTKFDRSTGKVRQEAKRLRDYLDEKRSQYKKHGELEKGFVENMADRLEVMIAGAESTPQVEAIREIITDLRSGEIRFTHIPTALWFESFIGRDPSGAGRWLRLNVKQLRKNLTIAGLIERGIVDPAEMRLSDIYASYGRRAGRDFALLEIRKAMEAEGLASRTKQPGMESLPRGSDAAKRLGFLKGWYIKPFALEYLTDFVTTAGKYHKIGPILGEIKMAQFFNPLFLPMYDVFQGAMLGTFRSIRRTPGAVFRGIRSAIKKDAAYWEAKSNGLASKPFSTTFDEFMINTVRTREGNALVQSLKGILKIRGKPGILQKIPVLNEFYRASWQTAWKLDETIRMMSYHFLRGKKLSPRDSAQLAAQFHADYASVPPRSRQLLNKIFFTPTFKMVMFNLHQKMYRSAIRSIAQPLTFGKVKANKIDRIRLGAVITVGAMAQGIDYYMTQQGWKRDVWGVKYSLQVDTEEGPREITLSFPNPATMWIKYGGRAMKALQQEGTSMRAFVAFLGMNRWELHPLYRAGYTFLENRNNAVYNPFDTIDKQGRDTAIFFTKEMIGIFRGVSETIQGGRPESPNVPRREELKKALPQMLDLLVMLKLAFASKRTPLANRVSFSLNQIQKELRGLARLKQLTPERIQN